VHIDLYVALAGLIVGFTVGLTGMGGGALMTPILVLLFKIQPLAAVSSDLVAAMVMKPVGGGVHIRRGTVNWELVKWLCIGSIPAAFCGVLILNSLGNGEQVQSRLKVILGVALLVAAGSIVAKSYLQGFAARRARRSGANGGNGLQRGPFAIKRIPTLAIGMVGGLVVGMTSVGSGSLIIVALLLLYPMLNSKQLVGTDLVQAIPLVASAALGHILFGDFKLDLTASVLIGSIPGVYLGARASARAPDGIVRPALVFVLAASALKLLNLDTIVLAWVLAALIVWGLPTWGFIDALGRDGREWSLIRRSRQVWVRLQGLGALFGVGFVAAVVYFARIRPRLEEASVLEPAPVLERAG
jgi:uncharacterized membrane protein YfcA